VVDTGEPFFVAANPFDFHDHPERGVTYWDWSLTAVKNEAGLVVNLVFTLADVTTRVRAELALHEREKAYAETLQKLNEGLEERVALRTAQLQVALVAAAQEIETRQAAEEALRKEELKFRTVVDFTYDWEVWNGVDGIPIYVSPSCERITGYSSREFLEDPGLFMRIVHPEDVSSVQARHARAVEHQDIEELEFRILTRTGELRWIGHACLPVYAADGTWLGQRSSNRDITERKRAEEAHAASEARAQAMLQTAMEGIWLVGADGRLLEVNAAACRMLGYTRSELLELSVPDIEAEESREATRAHIERVLINGSDRFASRHRRKDGTVFPVEISATFHPDTNQIVGFIRDITERVQTESKLGEQRRFLESITNALPGMVVYWTRELKCAFANSSALELFGKPLESVLGASFQTLLGERQFNEREAYIRGVLEGVPQRFEAELALPNGKVLNVWTQYIPQDRDGVILGFLVLAMDITELKQAQAALERSEKRLRLVVDTALDAVISIDQDGRVTSWNAQSESLFGWREDEARGRDIATLIIPEAHREAHRGGLARSLITGEGPMLNRRIETTAQHRDGHEFPLEISIAPVQFGGKVTYTAFARDLTERRRQESLAREMEAATAKSRMAAYLAHEINNPLAGINNSFRLIEGSFPPDHPDRRFLAIIRKELDRIAGIVRTAYSIHRPGLPQVKQASIPEILADLGVLIQSKLKDMEVRLEVEIPDPDLRGRIHEDLLRQVLFNVFQNALGACSRGGRIHCLCRTEGTHLVVVVTDNGSGIPVGVVPRIFEPGFTTKFGLETGGLGLGLSTCRTLLESVGGSIGFQHAEPGPGACFMIRLPWQS
jgi:PAS domain S-box-containing protein